MHEIVNEEQLCELAALIAKEIITNHRRGWSFYLSGDLGAGKTTFVRAFLTAMSHKGKVKSPTFTLVEPYQIELADTAINLYHFDLYRLSSPLELDEMGIEDYFSEQAILFIEWPEKGDGVLPQADIEIELTHHQRLREILIKVNNEEAEAMISNALALKSSQTFWGNI